MESSVRGIIMFLLKDVSYEWEDGRTALKNINLEIKKGEFVLISGKSGSGKSTLGSVMNGLIPHYYKGKMQGKAFVSGKDISKLLLHEIGHIVGTIFQDPRSQFFTTTTDEEIAFGLQTPHAVFAVIGGIICDLIIGNYESKGRMIIGYGTFALADFLGTVIPVILFGTASFVERASKWKMSEAGINEALSYFKVSWAVGFGLITFVLACIGAFVATRILKIILKKQE